MLKKHLRSITISNCFYIETNLPFEGSFRKLDVLTHKKKKSFYGAYECIGKTLRFIILTSFLAPFMAQIIKRYPLFSPKVSFETYIPRHQLFTNIYCTHGVLKRKYSTGEASWTLILFLMSVSTHTLGKR